MSVYVHLKSNTKFRAVFVTAYFLKNTSLAPFSTISGTKLNGTYRGKSVSLWLQAHNILEMADIIKIQMSIITDYKCLKDTGHCERITDLI